MSLADNLRAARRYAGLTQEKLAEKMNLSRGTIAKWESGAGMPGIGNLKKLAVTLCVPADYLLDLPPPVPGHNADASSAAKPSASGLSHPEKRKRCSLCGGELRIADSCRVWKCRSCGSFLLCDTAEISRAGADLSPPDIPLKHDF